MAVSRTASTAWKRRRASAITAAQKAGIYSCPLCARPLEYDRNSSPGSPELDHIIPVARGGTDDPTNLRIICRTCNRRLGGIVGKQRSLGAKTRPEVKSLRLGTSSAWG